MVLLLSSTQIGRMREGKICCNEMPYSTILNRALDYPSSRVFGKLTRAEDEAVCYNGLVVEWSRGRGLLGVDCFSVGGHFCYILELL